MVHHYKDSRNELQLLLSRPPPFEINDATYSSVQHDDLTSRLDQRIDIHNYQHIRGSSNSSDVEQLGTCKKLKNAIFYEESKDYVLTDLEDEDCPVCLEEYNSENPKIETKCDHHFHLSCIYEWMERSGSCPICGKILKIFTKIRDCNPTEPLRTA